MTRTNAAPTISKYFLRLSQVDHEKNNKTYLVRGQIFDMSQETPTL